MTRNTEVADFTNDTPCYYRGPSLRQRISQEIEKFFHRRQRRKIGRLLNKMTATSNLVGHARIELDADLKLPSSEPDRWMADHLIRMVQMYSIEGHSGFSAAWSRAAFQKLAAFEPLGPLTGEDSEWTEVSDGMLQNKRCGRVFKDENGAYDIDGRVFRDSDGGYYTNLHSRVYVTFPYNPVTEYVDRDINENGEVAA